MTFHDEPRQVEADAHARERFGLARAAHERRAAEPREILFAHPDALVVHLDEHVPVLPREAYADRAAPRRVLHGVPDHVPEDLLDAALVRDERERVRRLDGDGVPALVDRRVDVALDHLPYGGGEIELRGLQLERAAAGPRHLEQVVHETVHAVDLPFDRREVLLERVQVGWLARRTRAADAAANELREGF